MVRGFDFLRTLFLKGIEYNGPLVKTTKKISKRALGNTITMQLSHRNTPCQAPGSLMIHAALLCCIPQYIY